MSLINFEKARTIVLTFTGIISFGAAIVGISICYANLLNRLESNSRSIQDIYSIIDRFESNDKKQIELLAKMNTDIEWIKKHLGDK